MLYYIILSIVLCGISLGIFKLYKDFLSPSFLYGIAMLASVLCAIIGLLFWNNQTNLQFKAIMIVILAVLSFALGEFIVRTFFKKQKIFKLKKEKLKVKEIVVKKYIIALEIIFVIATCIWFYFDIKRIAKIGGYSGNNLFKIAYYYRKMTTLVTTELLENGQALNVIVSQMKKMCYILGYINIFVLVNNIILNFKKNYTNITSLIILIGVFFLVLLNGGRMQYFVYILSALFMAIFILTQQKKINIGDILKKYWKKMLIGGIGLCLAFYLILPLSGRKLDNNIISYLSFYFGAPVPSLNYYLNEEKEENIVWGQETFQGLQSLFYKLKLSNYIAPVTTEWVNFQNKSSQKVYTSNIFTAAKRYYNDFGFMGVILCSMLVGIVFTGIYLLLNHKPKIFLLILYSMYYYMIIDQVRDDLFYASFININLVINVLGILLLGYIILGENILPLKKIRKKVKK